MACPCMIQHPLAPTTLCQLSPCSCRCYILILLLGVPSQAHALIQSTDPQPWGRHHNHCWSLGSLCHFESQILCNVFSHVLVLLPFLLSWIEPDMLTKLLDLGNKWQPMALRYKSPVLVGNWVSILPVGSNSV